MTKSKFERSYCHIIAPVWTVRHPDMAAGWITEYVRQQGWEVHLLDLNAELFQRETRALVKDCWERLFVAMDPFSFREAVLQQHEAFIRQRIQQVVDQGCRVFGLLLLDGSARFVSRLSRMIKELAPDAHVVVGGTGATSLYRLRRRYGDSPPMEHPVDKELEEGHGIDSWVLGEGELTLMELLTRLEAGQDPHGILGLVLTEDGPYAKFKERALIKDLGALPHATWEGFDLDLFAYQALPFQLSRGCAFARCSHCGLKGYSRGFRVRPPEHAVAELQYMIERYGVRSFHFTDLGVNGDLDKLEAFCDEVIRAKLEIQWQSFVQIRADMTPGLLEKVVASGCTSLNYGFETGSDLVLGLMRKPYTADEAARVLRMTTDAGGMAIINLMCGHPGETEQEFVKTLDFLRDNASAIGMVASVSFTGVHIHSPLLDECNEFGLVLDDYGSWSSSEGNITLQLRNERVHRLTEHLRLLGIPCFEAFWEPDQAAAAAKADAALMVPEAHHLHISAVRVCFPGETEGGPLNTEQPVAVRVAYQAGAATRHAVFDLKITDLWGRVVFVTPAATESVREVPLQRAGWVQMILGAYDLAPGSYLVSVTARPLHSDSVFDRHVSRAPVEVMGTPQQRTEVKTPYTWTHHPGHLELGHDSPVVMVRVMDGFGVEPTALQAGQPVAVVVGLREAAEQQGLLGFCVLSEQQVSVFDSSHKEIDLRRPTVCRWSLDGLDVDPGTYTLEVALEVGQQRHVSQHHLSVQELGVAEERGLADLAPWERWEAVDDETEASNQGARLAAVNLVRQDTEGPLVPGSNLLVQQIFGGLPRGLVGLQCRSWITNDEGMVAVATATAQVVSPGGGAVLDQHLQLNLLQGRYQLHCAQWELKEDRPQEPTWSFPLVIESDDRQLGGGVIFAPHTLEVEGE